MRQHQKHFLERLPGEVPTSANNICTLYTSAKTMTFATMLHLHVADVKADPPKIAECLANHLSSVKADGVASSIEYLLTCIISNLVASCDLLESLNQRGRLPENEEKCKAHLNASKSCVVIIRSISAWLNLIFGRAGFIIEIVSEVDSPDACLGQLCEAIKQLASSKFFLLVAQSLTKALDAIVNTSVRNTFGQVLGNDGYLEQSFRSCLGAIRNSISLVHACETNIDLEPNTEWESAASVFLSFVVSSTRTFFAFSFAA